MAKLSLNKAAAYAGKAKADILKALRSNDPMTKLSGEKNAKGHWEIDTAELDRVFPKKVEEPPETGRSNRFSTPENTSSTNALETEVKLLREMLTKTEQDRDKWQALADKQADAVKMLTHQQDNKSQERPAPKKGRIARAWEALTG